MAWSSAKRRSPCSSSKLGEQPLDVVERVRAGSGGARPARAARASGSRRSRRGSRRRACAARSISRSRSGVCGSMRQRLDLLQQDADRFFELEQVRHGIVCCSQRHAQSSQIAPTRRRTVCSTIRRRRLSLGRCGRGRAARRRRARAAAAAAAVRRRARGTRGDRRGAATSSSPAPRSRRPCGGAFKWIARRASSRSLSAESGRSSVATSRADSSSRSNLPRTSSIASASMSDAVLAERLREHHDFDAAGDVVEHEDAIGSPFLVFSGAQAARRCRRPRRPASRTAVELARVALRAERLAAPRRSARADGRSGRGRAPPSRSASCSHLGPRRRVGQPDDRRRRRPRRRRRTAATGPARGRAACRLPCSMAPVDGARTAWRGAAGERHAAAGTSESHAPGLDQALEHPLVHQAQVELLAERDSSDVIRPSSLAHVDASTGSRPRRRS